MIAFAKPPKAKKKHDDAKFEEEMLPKIRQLAQQAFRRVRQDQREELTSEVIANAFVAYRRLVDQDKAELAYATPLANFAIKQVRTGRKVGCKLNVRDVTSRYCQLAKGTKVQRLDGAHDHDGNWEEIVVEDRNATPADIVATRIDFREWLRSLSRRERRIAQTLATNETTQRTAQKFKLSEGRISQIRRELERAWQLFQDELPGTAGEREPSLPAVDRSLAPLGEAV